MVRGLPAADVERAIAHASAGRLVTLMILTHVLRLLQGRKLPGSILGSSVLSLFQQGSRITLESETTSKGRRTLQGRKTRAILKGEAAETVSPLSKDAMRASTHHSNCLLYTSPSPRDG